MFHSNAENSAKTPNAILDVTGPDIFKKKALWGVGVGKKNSPELFPVVLRGVRREDAVFLLFH